MQLFVANPGQQDASNVVSYKPKYRGGFANPDQQVKKWYFGFKKLKDHDSNRGQQKSTPSITL